MDLFQEFEEIEVVLTITTDDERVERLFEPQATSLGERLSALEDIRYSHIRYKDLCLCGPFLPGNPERLVEPFGERVDKVIDKWLILSRNIEYFNFMPH